MRKFLYTILLLTAAGGNIQSQSRWAFEANGGTVYNVPMPLSIEQNGYPRLNLVAKYYTEPFRLPVYWVLRLSRWQNGKSWEIESIHHKLYLENKPDEVKEFGISHGFNIVCLNRGFDNKYYHYRLGLGVVFAHPESIVREQKFSEPGIPRGWGYFISGPVANAAIAKPLQLHKRIFINLEAKTTLAYARVGVANGHANVFNWAFHLVFGLGTNFIHSGPPLE